jgi:hypothetical protein
MATADRAEAPRLIGSGSWQAASRVSSRRQMGCECLLPMGFPIRFSGKHWAGNYLAGNYLIVGWRTRAATPSLYQ